MCDGEDTSSPEFNICVKSEDIIDVHPSSLTADENDSEIDVHNNERFNEQVLGEPFQFIKHEPIEFITQEPLEFITQEPIEFFKQEPIEFIDVDKFDDQEVVQDCGKSEKEALKCKMVMKKKRKKTREELLEYARIKQRTYRAKMDPEKKKIYKLKEQMRLVLRKKLGKIKIITEMSPEEQEKQREAWRATKQKQRNIGTQQPEDIKRQKKETQKKNIDEIRKINRERKRKYRQRKKEELEQIKKEIRKENEFKKLKKINGVPDDYCYYCELKKRLPKFEKINNQRNTIEDKRKYERERKQHQRLKQKLENEIRNKDNSIFKDFPCYCKKRMSKKLKTKCGKKVTQKKNKHKATNDYIGLMKNM